jgi:lipopolysaccharide transport system permease protein
VCDTIQDGDWTLIIKPKSKLLNLNLRELIHYRDLVWLFVKRDIATVYKQTILGPLWFVIQPVITTIIYTFVFGNLAQLSTDGVPRTLFYFGGTMLWNYFQVTLTNVSDTFVQNAKLFSKVYFPRLAVPLSKIYSNMVALSIQIVTLVVLYGYFAFTGTDVRPNWGILLLPAIILWLAALAAGFGMIISALTTKYRDLRQLVAFGMHLWMYATPVVYPVSQIPDNLRPIMNLNPVSAPIELFRAVMFSAGTPDPGMLIWSALSSFLLVFFGLLLFHRNESTFVDVA